MVHEITSTIDWCEDNWVYHDEVAEWWNTTSAILYVWVGLRIMFCTPKGLTSGGKHLEVVRMNGFNIFMVGVGTIWFHGRLTYEGQMVDEIWMLVMNACGGYMLLKADFPWAKYVIFLAISLFSCVHIKFGFVRIFQATFGATSVFLLCLINWYVWRKVSTSKDWNYDRTRNFMRGQLRICFLVIVAMFCWGSDQLLCKSFQLGLPNPQLHAVFHILSAIGLKGIHILIMLALLPEEVGRFGFYLGFIPYVEVIDKMKSKKTLSEKKSR